MTVISQGAKFEFSDELYYRGLTLGVERYLRDRVAGIVDGAADSGVKSGQGRNPWCEIDVQGVFGEMAFAHLADVAYDETTEARAESGGFDTRMPSGLYVDVKWAEAPGQFGNLLVRNIKAPYLRDREDVVCVLMYGRMPLNQKALRTLAHTMPANPVDQVKHCQALLQCLPKLVRCIATSERMPFTFGGWMWGDYAVDPMMWVGDKVMPEPCYRVEQRHLITELPTRTLPERVPLTELLGWRTVAPVKL